MMEVRRFVALACAVVFALVTWMSTSALAQRKMSRDEQAQAQVLLELVDNVATGQPAPSDAALTLHTDFIKSEGSTVYTPYILNIEPGKLTSNPLAMYLRIAKVGDEQAAKAVAARKDKPQLSVQMSESSSGSGSGEEGGGGGGGMAIGGISQTAGSTVKRAVYPFEDFYFFNQPKDGRIARAFSVPSGEYDLFVAMRERPKGLQSKMTVLTQKLTVPDFTKGLSTSSVIVAAGIEPSKGQLDAQKQLEQPYTIGGMRITPAPSTKLSKAGELSVVFFVYNPGLTAGKKPDIEVEYGFYTKTGTSEKLFNRTRPQPFNEQTLPPEFNAAAGHQIMAGQAVPLGSFPEGDYRLEIKVTDKTNSTSVTRNINFTVAGS